MDRYNQHHDVPAAHPPPSTSYPPPEADSHKGQYVMAPPPIGYPVKDDGNNQGHVPVETRTRGFWKGCCAGLCCCCCLDICF